MDYMWWLVGYVGLAYLIDWVVDWSWWRYVDWVLKGKSNQVPLASSTESQIPSITPMPTKAALAISDLPSIAADARRMHGDYDVAAKWIGDYLAADASNRRMKVSLLDVGYWQSASA